MHVYAVGTPKRQLQKQQNTATNSGKKPTNDTNKNNDATNDVKNNQTTKWTKILI